MQLLGPLDLRPWPGSGKIDWIIGGGEKGARHAGIWSRIGRVICWNNVVDGRRGVLASSKCGSAADPSDLMAREFPR